MEGNCILNISLEKKFVKYIGTVGTYKVEGSKKEKLCLVGSIVYSGPNIIAPDYSCMYRNLMNLQHTNLAKCLGFVKTKDYSGIVSEMIYGVTLRDDIDENVKAKVYLAESIVLNRLSQLLQAVDALSRLDIYHGGLSPCNIMLCKDDEVKVCNYGVQRGTLCLRRKQ